MTTTTTRAEGRGSMRRRARDSWELRVYAGVDPATGRQRYATRTVHGSKRTATRALEELVVNGHLELTADGQQNSPLTDMRPHRLRTADLPGSCITSVV